MRKIIEHGGVALVKSNTFRNSQRKVYSQCSNNQ
jgi:hypothetical protein